MAGVSDLSFENPVFSAYAFYAAVLTLKVLFVVLCVVKNRIVNNALPAREDYEGKGIDLKDKPIPLNEDVERARRAHLNDIENIPLFLIIGLAYVLSGPALSTALWVFRIFTAGRFLHTISYVFLKIGPPRGLGFILGLGAIIFVSVNVALAGFKKGFY